MVGNLKNYTKIDILRCLLKIDAPLSRLELSKKLDLGEGTIRSILDILKRNELLSSSKKGHHLSINGKNIANKIKNNVIIKEVDSIIIPKPKSVAIQIKHPKNMRKAFILRDIAIKNGADGAVILKYDLHFKKIRILDSDHEENFKEIEEKFSLEDNDLLIITYANSYKLAEHGALAVAIEIDSNLKYFMNNFK